MLRESIPLDHYFRRGHAAVVGATTFPRRLALASSAFTFEAMLLSNHFYNSQVTHTQIQRPSDSAKLYLLSCGSFCHRSLLPLKSHREFPRPLLSSSVSTGTLAAHDPDEAKDNEIFDFLSNPEAESFSFKDSFGVTESKKRFDSPGVEVKELEELPEQWRRSRLAWLCKELPAHGSSTLTRVLNAQRKWIRQDDCTYVTVHCMRIRENETSFRVYKWMIQQHWFKFDFALATKLADYLGKERKYLKCHEIFDDIINQGLVPNESTFHILIVAYLSSSASNALEQACSIYNRMIHLGGYKPPLSLHNSLFRALVSKKGDSCKPYLKQAEFIFHNLTTTGLEIQSDIYGGLIWLHSYQDVVDKERITSLRTEMNSAGFEESAAVLVSVLRACSKEGDLVEAERIWMKIISSNSKPPTQAFVYLMEVYSKVGKPMKSLEIFRSMQNGCSSSVVAYYKIIEVLCKARESELAESLMLEFINSGMKPLMQSFVDLMDMYANLNLHDKLESTFLLCLEKCRPNRTVYGMYLDSLVQIGNLERAEEIFTQMLDDEAVGVNTRSCNTILRGYITCDKYLKAEKIYDLMCQKKFDIESSLMEKVEYILSLRQEQVKKSISPKLSKEQREILVGLLLGGLRIELDEAKRNYAIKFVFRENFEIHSFLKRHLYHQFREWLACTEKLVDDDDGDSNIPREFATISHSNFMFYANQFYPHGQPVIPKLIHRWLTPRSLAYWYMYGGYKTSSGDILLKVKVGNEDALRIVEKLKARSLDCRVKRKGTVLWIGFLGSNAMQFWRLTEPFILTDLKDSLEAGIKSSNGTLRSKATNFGIEFDSDWKASDYSNSDNSHNLL